MPVAIVNAPVRTIASTLVVRIREDLIRGVLEPGSKLLLRELSEHYNVGVNPLREALARLAAAGLVIVEDGRGFRVSDVSRDDLEDLSRAKREVFTAAIRTSIQNGDVKWEARVVAAHHQLKATMATLNTRKFDEAAYEDAHRAFHVALVDGCGSSWLLHFVNVLYDQTRRYRYLAMLKPENHAAARIEHQQLMEAAVARNVRRATQLVLEHIVVPSDVTPGSGKVAKIGRRKKSLS